jgi:hypothetical protein
MADPTSSLGVAATPPTEQELWELQRPTAEAALDFASHFLGCRMGPKRDKLLDARAKARLLDICRAVSVVESRHGTAGANQPKRDPFQCGNPDDSWWKELTGQSGQGSRFIRGPGLTNLWAKQVASEAKASPTFDGNATLGRLGDVKKGHRDSGFTPAHSYFWGVLYLLHRINSEAGEPSYACGDVSRERLISGAVTYNGGGVPDYRKRLEKALAEFDGLKAIEESAAPFDDEDSSWRAAMDDEQDAPDPGPGLPRTAAILMLAAGIVLVGLLNWDSRSAARFAGNITEEAPKVVTSLTVIAIFMERALAVINSAWLGEQSERARAAVRAAVAAKGPGLVERSEAYGMLRAALMTEAELEARKRRLRVVIGFLFGLVISAAGIRTLAGLAIPQAQVPVTPDVDLFNFVDIILTAGLLAGGSEGMAKLATLIRAAVERTTDRLRSLA